MDYIEAVTNISHLNGLIKQKRNAEVKSILLKGLPSNFINKGESSLVHTAVVFNNIDIIALLFSFGFDINGRNALGQTPLLLAAHNESHRAIQLLLALDAEVLIDDFRGENDLQVLLDKEKNTPTYIIGSLLERSIKSKVSPHKIADELAKAKYPLEHVLDLNNTDLTREVLKRTNQIDKATSYSLLERAMRSRNMNNVHALLHHGPDVFTRRHRFIKKVTHDIYNPTTRPFFEQIFNWEIVDRASIHKINRYFTDEDETSVQLLLDMGYDKYCEEKFEFNVLVSLFGNKNISLRYIVKLLQNKQFDVTDSRDENGNSALHVATMKQNKSAVVYLLKNGADPNVTNMDGKTPLFFIDGNEDIAEILIEAGADLQVMTDDGESVVNDNFVFANLMIMRARGIPINDELWQRTIGLNVFGGYNTYMQDKCESHSQDLEWMKNRWVSETITLFFVLTEKFERLARHVKNEETCEEIRKSIGERSLNPPYVRMLKKNLKRARELNKLRCKAAEFLREQMQIASDDHLVIRMIVGFFSYEDLLVFDELEDDNDESDDSSQTEDDDDDESDDSSETDDENVEGNAGARENFFMPLHPLLRLGVMKLWR